MGWLFYLPEKSILLTLFKAARVGLIGPTRSTSGDNIDVPSIGGKP
jgi:hypothetical protein